MADTLAAFAQAGPEPVNTPPRARLHGLDALRGIAALSVCLFHWFLRYPSFAEGRPLGHHVLLPGLTWFEAGTLPVMCFFMISGFVISWTVERSRTPLDFVVSRVSRLYPTYWAALAVGTAVSVLFPFPGPPVTVTQVLVNVTMLQSAFGVPDIDGVFWSLAVELTFYVQVLVVFTLGLWPASRWLVPAWLGLCLLDRVLPMVSPWHVPWRVEVGLNLKWGPLLAAGMVLYFLWRGHGGAWRHAALALCAVCAVLSWSPVMCAACLVTGAAMLATAHGRLRWLETAPLVMLGAISYALYASHELVSFTLMRAADQAGLPHGVGIGAAAVTVLALAAAITHWVEQPALHAVRSAWRRVRPVPRPA